MKYYVVRLKFLTPVHFGTAENKKGGSLQAFNCCADTFFSALVTEAAGLDEALCGKFINAVEQGSLVFSDLLPYYSGEEEELYVPVPLNRREKINPLDLQLSFKELCLQYEAVREHESAAYIRAGGVKAYLAPFGEAQGSPKREFGWNGVQRRMDFRTGSRAYYVNNYTFAPGAGLYFIAALADDALLESLVKTVELLGLGGIGGRRSSGFGKFAVAGGPQLLNEDCSGDAGVLHAMLNDRQSRWQMALSVLCPAPGQIADVKAGAYGLVKRSGFIYNAAEQSWQKRSSVYMLRAGSCFPKRVAGQLLKFAAEGAQHGVYRCGKALYMGLPV